ncbi:MAG: type II toxin-antitoxin system RatA family toxin [Magnetococcales bacterium]|nr:type II toxin-antitoxin system RatA family toxin [Magnetococcales bacterium]MBF0308189.1 type II toxin-antitoxin system RatA family toxin [Magnetococcales bacterium]
MPRREASETVPFTPEQMYDLVVDMASYSQFLPWCVKARKFDETPQQFIAEMTIAFKGLRETFQTVDTVIPGREVTIRLKSGPFRALESQWRFTPLDEGTRIDFYIDFQFRNPILEMTLGPVFSAASKQMVEAFRQRAHALYNRS